MPSCSRNFSHNSSSETVNCCTQLLRYFSPIFNRRHFQRLHSCVWWATGLSFKHGPPLKSIGLRSGDEGGHTALLRWKLCLHQDWILLDMWEGALSCRMVKSSFLKFSFISKQGRGQHIYDVHICFDFATLFHKNQRIFPSFWPCGPNHDRCGLLAAINCYHVFRNVFWVLGQRSVVLWIQVLPPQWIFLYKKTISPFCVPDFSKFQTKLAYQLFCCC